MKLPEITVSLPYYYLQMRERMMNKDMEVEYRNKEATAFLFKSSMSVLCNSEILKSSELIMTGKRRQHFENFDDRVKNLLSNASPVYQMFYLCIKIYCSKQKHYWSLREVTGFSHRQACSNWHHACCISTGPGQNVREHADCLYGMFRKLVILLLNII